MLFFLVLFSIRFQKPISKLQFQNFQIFVTNISLINKVDIDLQPISPTQSTAGSFNPLHIRKLPQLQFSGANISSNTTGLSKTVGSFSFALFSIITDMLLSFFFFFQLQTQFLQQLTRSLVLLQAGRTPQMKRSCSSFTEED